MSGWRVVVDTELCQAHQNCQLDAPEVFGFDRDADKAVLLVAHPDDTLAPSVRRAVAYCPAMALSIVEEDG
ncbi:MAG TPA: ferredoxin [Rugosimonospora sp.]|nr:ferredoxin [Rugosimonospora sp.]